MNIQSTERNIAYWEKEVIDAQNDWESSADESDYNRMRAAKEDLQRERDNLKYLKSKK